MNVLIDLSILNLHLDGDDLNIIYKEQPEFLLSAAAKEMLYGRIGIFTRIL
ncbi:hypothetical protein HanPI659440_Chr05g0184481 [Helianthus annuus]|uniref:Uncharacterized protein n=1 Tax=Helianthus annuus TaxID=4232 RepID=A0A251UKD0_HELAN|nr:hypothetical protein HanXRQr2_Chr05g0193791 [Helianthus annuus]KAJ0583093.1 hypothetical protein HanHA89_Chr05g0172781 [Helianthus annuus]KAJ0745844.1 hypothetical protein HanOQP8_Chr05g0170841 [Helianthus annuus]KAJ0787802.1 hypothetical protein HanPI659440_Chr05g0184481 [Helianthus annuus]KAJ0921072.1 hypothetical protein HanPSC8_Chr05g0187291 [Helianthus annuus]